ncbi:MULTISPECIES: hypothetical protein [Streptosporangium]|uniref:Uncharacterized protein n=1 Tax=Streptosporangium brasiliense TaxID=47480 RepID=A0ABT9RGN4_9ACTN|nr:hypothetical protein [Streptosporangium brasiliense]MDP9868268.1 hypothetical protein [Streptosporangium brasiliense]
MVAPQEEPTWQPISMLAMLTAHVEDGVTMVREQHATLKKGHATPYVLDDATVTQVKRSSPRPLRTTSCCRAGLALGRPRRERRATLRCRALHRPVEQMQAETP